MHSLSSLSISNHRISSAVVFRGVSTSVLVIFNRLIIFQILSLQTNSANASKCFVGREKNIKRMLEHIKGGGSEMESRIIFLSGLQGESFKSRIFLKYLIHAFSWPFRILLLFRDDVLFCYVLGIGKTSLVNELCRRLQEDSLCKNVLRFSCHQTSSTIGIKEMFLKKFDIDSDEQLIHKLSCYSKEGNWIIVMDNAKDVIQNDSLEFGEFLRELMVISKKSSCCIVIISSEGATEFSKHQSLQSVLLTEKLNDMSDEDSLQLIDIYLGKRQLKEEEKIRLMEMCLRHPLAMQLVCRHLSFKDITFSVSFYPCFSNDLSIECPRKCF